MNKEIDFETYLIISYGKFEIFLLDIKNHKDIYQEEWKQVGQRISSSIWCKKV